MIRALWPDSPSLGLASFLPGLTFVPFYAHRVVTKAMKVTSYGEINVAETYVNACYLNAVDLRNLSLSQSGVRI